jgi:preprotein translocase subunit Sec63
VTAKAVFENSRNIGEEILDLFFESYPAYKNVLAIWQDLVTNSEMRPNVNLLNQLHVMMENPTKIRTQEVDTMQQILTSCDQGYGEELLKNNRAICLKD